jgi:hypothetical protein
MQGEFFRTVFEFLGQVFIQNDVFKLQEVFSEVGIRVFFENGTRKFPENFLFYRFETNKRCLKDSKNSSENKA